MEGMARIRVVVKGRVQGVYYRATTQQQALAIGVTGWVRNLDNGDVEFEAQGTEEQLARLLLWAQCGPSRAQVDSLLRASCPLLDAEQTFEVRR